jgi:EAL domain-containing protein (putative c-di-GMP-specific phosphodiesterase class I)
VSELRLERLLTDRVTGLPLQPPAALSSEGVRSLGVVYLQIGRFAGIEGVYGWEVYDRVLRVVADALEAAVQGTPTQRDLVSMMFTGCDGFYLLLRLPEGTEAALGARLEKETGRLKSAVQARLREKMGAKVTDLLALHASWVTARDDARVRPSRNLVRALREAARIVEGRENSERLRLVSQCRAIIADRRVRPVFQPVVDIQAGRVIGYEALIRGPQGGELESPDFLFAAAHASDLGLELENLCVETIFERLPRGVRGRKLFVNASPQLLAHPVFLDERNLAALSRAHGDFVMEVSEKEVVSDYAAFRSVLDRLRGRGIGVAIDDAGSGYSGLEAILQLRPNYIKIANTIVKDLHADGIKREIITALGSLGHQIKASLVAEGIEQRAELDALKGLGIGYGQGFFLGRPSPRLAAAH